MLHARQPDKKESPSCPFGGHAYAVWLCADVRAFCSCDNGNSVSLTHLSDPLSLSVSLPVPVCVFVVQVTGLQISWAAISDIIVDEEDRDGDNINWRYCCNNISHLVMVMVMEMVMVRRFSFHLFWITGACAVASPNHTYRRRTCFVDRVQRY